MSFLIQWFLVKLVAWMSALTTIFSFGQSMMNFKAVARSENADYTFGSVGWLVAICHIASRQGDTSTHQFWSLGTHLFSDDLVPHVNFGPE